MIEDQTLVQLLMIDHLSLMYTGQLSYVLCFLTCFIRFMAPFYLTCRNCELLCILSLFDCGLTIHVAPPDFIPYKALFLFVYKQTLNKVLAEQRIHLQYVYVITKGKVNKRVLEQKVPYMYMCVVKIIKIIKIFSSIPVQFHRE